MVRIHPVPGFSVDPAYAARVSPPPHDNLTALERRKVMEAEPYSFLNVLRSSYDYPPESRPPPDEVRRHAAAHLQRLIDEGIFITTPEPSYYLYALKTPGHRQVGVIAELSVDLIESVIKPHERIRPERADDLATFLADVRVSSSPVVVTYPADRQIDQLVDRVTSALEPILSFTSDDGLHQTVWRLSAGDRHLLEDGFDGIDLLYLLDGHHRSAAAQLHAAQEPGEHYLLVAMFPSDQLQVGGFDRYVTTSVDETVILERLAEQGFAISKLTEIPKPPPVREEMVMFLGGDWYRLVDQLPAPADVVDALAVSSLHQRIIRSVMEADDADVSEVSYVPSTGTLQVVEDRCGQSKEVGLAVLPPTVEEVMKVAEAGGLMPPKSTFFVPKARSGVFLVPR